MGKFGVTCTRIFNGYISVEAESADEAMKIAEEKSNEIDWTFGEETIDYADPLDENGYPVID